MSVQCFFIRDSQSFPLLSLIKTANSELRNIQQKATEYISYKKNYRVPSPLSINLPLLTSSSLVLASLYSCNFDVLKATLTLAGLHTLVFWKPNGVILNHYSLQPDKIVHNKELYRLITAAFIHLDAPHMLINIGALVESGKVLENKMGSVPFFVDVMLTTFVSHGLYVGFAWIEHIAFKRDIQYNTGGIGFSCVTFALNVVTGTVNEADPEIESSLPLIPVCYHVWLQLLITKALFPNSSFFGHIVGVAAGLFRTFCPQPFIWIRRRVTNIVQFITRRRLRNRMHDEYQLQGRRNNTRLVIHLGVLIGAYIWHILETKGEHRNQRDKQHHHTLLV